MSTAASAERSSLLTPTGISKVNYSHVPTIDQDNHNEDNQYKAAILAHKQSKKYKEHQSYILNILMSILLFLIILSLQISVRVFARIQTVPMQEYPHILILIICLVSIPIEWILKSGNFCNLSINALNDKNDKTQSSSLHPSHQYYNSINDGTINFHQIIISKRWMLFLAAVFDISNLCLQIFSLTNIKVSMDIMFLQQLSLPLGIVLCKLLFRQATYSYKQYIGTWAVIFGVIVYFHTDIYAYSMMLLSTYAPSFIHSTTSTSNTSILPSLRLSQNQLMWYCLYLLSYLFTGFAWLLRERAICHTDPNDDVYAIQQTKQSLSTWSSTIQFLLAVCFALLLSFFTSELDQVTDWTSFCANIQYTLMDFMTDFIDGCYCVMGVVRIQSHRSHLNSDIHIQSCSYSYMYISASVMANMFYSFIVLNLLRHHHYHSSNSSGGNRRNSNNTISSKSPQGWFVSILDIVGMNSYRAGMSIFWWASLISFPLTYIVSSLLLEPHRENVFTSTQTIALSIVTLGLSFIIIATRRKKVGIPMTTTTNNNEEDNADNVGYTHEEDDMNANDVSLGSIVSPLSFKETSSPVKAAAATVTFQSPRTGSDIGTADINNSPRGIGNRYGNTTTTTTHFYDRYWNSHHAHEILPWNQPLDYLFPYAGTLHFWSSTDNISTTQDAKFLKVLNQAYANGTNNANDDEEEEEEEGEEDVAGVGESSNHKRTRNRKNTLDSLAVLYNKNNLHTNDDDEEEEEEEEDVHEYNKNDENENDDDHFNTNDNKLGNRGRRSTTTISHSRSRKNTRFSTDSSTNAAAAVVGYDGCDDDHKRSVGRVSISSSSVAAGGGSKIRESMLSTHSMNTFRSERSFRRLSAQHSVRSVDSVSSGDVVVIDQGSCETRVGYAEGYKPKSVFPSVVSSIMTSQDHETPHYQYSVGNSALLSSFSSFSNSSSSSYVKPYRDGVILDDHWNEMEAIYEHCFTDCLNNIDTMSTKVFLTEAFRSPKKTREQTIETMFELFEVQACYLHVQPVLALFASGLTSGCVVDSGEYSTTVYPVAEGYHLTNSSQKVSYGGSHVTECLAKYFIDKGFSQSLHLPVDFQYDSNHPHHHNNNNNNYNFHHSQSVKIARDIKEKYGYVLTSPIEKRGGGGNNQSFSNNSLLSRKTNHASHTLPDGTRVSLPLEHLYECTDILFQPSLIGKDDDGLHTVIAKSINSCSVDLRKELYGNIILAGGNCILKGMTERITTEMKKNATATASNHNNHSSSKHNITNNTYNTLNGLKVTRTAWADSSTAVWKGGSVIASISTFEDRWISCSDYDEYGANCVHEKCPAYL